jgi:hypothetical protein
MTQASSTRTALVVALIASSSACGKKGDPLPPIRVLPQAVSNVKLAQSGNVVRLSYQVPRAMTDGSAPPILEIELSRAEGPGDFAKVAKKTLKPAAPGEVLTEDSPLPAPKTSVRASLRASAKGRWSAATTVLTLVVRDPVEIPASVCAEPAREGAHVEWAPIAPPSPMPLPGAAGFARPSSPSSSPSPATTAPTPTPTPVPISSQTPVPSPGASPTPSHSPTPPAVTYRLFRRDESGTYAAPLNTLPLAATSHEDAAAPTETTSCYVVRAVVSIEPLVESGDSNEVCVRLEDVVAPATPGGVAAFVRDGNVEVVWDAVSATDLAGYRVKRANAGAPPVVLKEVDPATTSFIDATAAPGVVYQYTVTAHDKAGNESPPSPPAQAGTQAQ